MDNCVRSWGSSGCTINGKLKNDLRQVKAWEYYAKIADNLIRITTCEWEIGILFGQQERERELNLGTIFYIHF